VSDQNAQPIALVLSGGGVRAMVFHLGMLRLLAERGAFERVRRLSTVSGGSLLVGLILRKNAMVWPTSVQFIDTVYPALRQQLCARSLMMGAVRQLFRPWNWRYLFSRANLLALA
jgi:NTE family protein